MNCLKNVRIRIYKTIILPVVQYGYQTWPLTFWEEHGLDVFEYRVLRRIFGPKRDEVQEGRENCIMRSYITGTLCRV
jgi:hypothetical protein